MAAAEPDSSRWESVGSSKPSTRFEGRQKAIPKNLKISWCCKFDSRLEWSKLSCHFSGRDIDVRHSTGNPFKEHRTSTAPFLIL